jgi:hypothetical protein
VVHALICLRIEELKLVSYVEHTVISINFAQNYLLLQIDLLLVSSACVDLLVSSASFDLLVFS